MVCQTRMVLSRKLKTRGGIALSSRLPLPPTTETDAIGPLRVGREIAKSDQVAGTDVAVMSITDRLPRKKILELVSFRPTTTSAKDPSIGVATVTARERP
jgi:hypothetical protein